MTTNGRTHPEWVNDRVKRGLTNLLQAAEAKSVTGYREYMRELGASLGEAIKGSLPPAGRVLFIATVEDADFLARGVLGSLSLGDRVRVYCYWNERDPKKDIAPIVHRYEEPLDKDSLSAIIVVKSIISGACVVRTNLIEAMEGLHRQVPIFVLAPVMHADASKKLKREFPPSVASRFQIVTCAVDQTKTGDTVVPGVGGSVYELLGLGDQHEKNRHQPRLIAERATELAGAADRAT
jgi:hypothetical protein